MLQQLSNIDKHRLLNVVEFAAFDLGPVGITPEPVVKFYGAATGRVEAGDVLVRVEFPRPIEGHEVELRPTFGWYESVPYERGGEVDYLRIDRMLTAIYQMVVTTASDMNMARRIERGEFDPNAEAERGNEIGAWASACCSRSRSRFSKFTNSCDSASTSAGCRPGKVGEDLGASLLDAEHHSDGGDIAPPGGATLRQDTDCFN
ncbi:hypothetical protein GCM10023194_63730 [Planotetraspora phitsanulokensis]|uniref:Uncharacterized protein n=1 Tax=Planotetraspora phitsanulokensis TaxID=575192 RepID=A0A8J3XJJ0_9ACTN|nr:hypothetical protein [Planotetraspora phitsanulokensis]GII43474.1 hypothetical protein Pph01_84770 [Planotetraspora phitsanulokensis]